MTESILYTTDLTKNFGDLIAVNKLNISVARKEIFGLLGPNGAGKTTAIKMFTTLLKPTSGEAFVAGFSIIKKAMDVRRVIGYVPQMLSADATLSGYENLLIFAKLFDIPRQERQQRVQEALDFMGLKEVSNRLVRTYSGGMIRRLEIAQSVLQRPQILFLDEPTIGLDPLARKAVWKLILDLRSNYGTTIFMTTHMMDEADNLCERVAIMHHGKIAAIGSPHELKMEIGENVSLEDVFIHYTGEKLDNSGESYRDTARIRRTARRLG